MSTTEVIILAAVAVGLIVALVWWATTLRRRHELQDRFGDEPDAAFEEADRLVADVMVERGYPVGDVDRQMADLSVEHSDVLSHYRTAHDIAQASAQGRKTTTEDFRLGMVHYRALFSALVEDHADAPTAGR